MAAAPNGLIGGQELVCGDVKDNKENFDDDNVDNNENFDDENVDNNNENFDADSDSEMDTSSIGDSGDSDIENSVDDNTGDSDMDEENNNEENDNSVAESDSESIDPKAIASKGSSTPCSIDFSWSSLPLPELGEFAPNNFYVLYFWNLPAVKSTLRLRNEFLLELKKSLPAEFKAPDWSSSIREQNVMVLERDEPTEALRLHQDVNAASSNVIVCSYAFVPFSNLAEAKWVQANWHNKTFHGKQIYVRWSRYGNQRR